MKHFVIHCRKLTVYTAEYCLYIFLFLGSEGGHGTVPPLRTLVYAKQVSSRSTI